MDVDEALRIVATYVQVPGQSDDDLLDRVSKSPAFTPPSKQLMPAMGLDQGVVLRPVEILHELSYATRPMYQDDLYDQYVQWGLLRYLGFFDVETLGGRSRLKLSDAGKRIVGNQRGVASEEMGIGFGAHLARRWFQHTGAAGAAISIVDIDVALRDGFIVAAGSKRAVRQVSAHRPDYLVIANDTRMRTRYRVRNLECKGTTSQNYAITQMAKAVRQLDGVTVGGRTPQGLAVSTVTGGRVVNYLAIDPTEEDQTEPVYEVTSSTLEEVANFELGDSSHDVPPMALASSSLRASWAALADYGGNIAALDRWALPVMRRRLERRARPRVVLETPYGAAIGTRASFPFQGRQLEVWYLLDKQIDLELTQGTLGGISEAQAEFALRATDAPSLDLGNALFSATSDGSIFGLTFT